MRYLENKLNKWCENKLVTQKQVDAIRAFEKENNESHFVYVLMTLAAFSIGLGIISIVASNWDMIPTGVKLTVDFALLGSLLYGVLECQKRGYKKMTELFSILSLLMVGATIGLVGQVFHLNGDLPKAMLFWAVCGAPLLYFSKTFMLPTIWIIVLLVGLPKLFEVLEPLVLYLNLDVLERWLSNFTDAYPTLSTVIYSLGGGYLLGGLARAFAKWGHQKNVSVLKVASGFLIFAMYLSVLIGEVILRHDIRSPWIASIMTAAFLLSMAAYGSRTDRAGFFNKNILLIELYFFYLYIVYSVNLWATGWGMILFGLSMLAFIWTVRKTNKYLKGKKAV